MPQRLVASIVVLFLLAVGFWGQYELSPDNLSTHLSTSFYQLIMLFFLGGEWTMEHTDLPLQIEIVRIFAPMVAITSIILVFASSTRVSMSNYFTRFYHDHIVVVGLGEKCWQFLRTCDSKESIVVVERNPDNLLLRRVRDLGFKVITGDIFDDEMFNRVNLKQASVLIAFTGNDGVNVETAIEARNHIRADKNRQRHLKVHIHLNEIGLAHQLENYPKFFADFSITEISFFSVYDLSSRLLLKDYPPEIFADVAAQDRVHLAIYGFNRLAEKIMIEATLQCQYANGSRLRFTIFDEQANVRQIKLRSEYPYLEKICDYEFVQQSIIGPHIFQGKVTELLPSITQHIICGESDEESLKSALMLRSALLEKRASNSPILVRMQQSNGLAQLLESNTGDSEIPDGLYPFGMLDQVLHSNNILNNQLDDLARTIHQVYLDMQSAEGSQAQATHQSWDDLRQWERKQNLLKADHLSVKLRAIRCIAGPAPFEPVTLSAVEAELLATMEHQRYVNNKYFDGWEYGKVKIEEARINPYLLPWKELSAEQREKEIEDVHAQPHYALNKPDNSIRRTLVIGVTGHRLNKLDVHNEYLRQRIVQSLKEIKVQHRNHHFVVLSSLAEGADRLVAQLAMNILDAALHVPLPLPYDLYITDFTSAASIEEFKIMVGKAEQYYEMPMKFGNIRELASGAGSVVNESRNKQYALAGAYIIQRSDLLIAVYDGKPEKGTGGTAQIVRWNDHGSLDFEYQYPHQYFLPPNKSPTIIIDPNPTSPTST